MPQIEINGEASTVTDEELAALIADGTMLTLIADDGSRTDINYASPRVIETPEE